MNPTNQIHPPHTPPPAYTAPVPPEAAVAADQVFHEVHGNITPGYLESGSLKHVTVTQIHAADGSESSADTETSSDSSSSSTPVPRLRSSLPDIDGFRKNIEKAVQKSEEQEEKENQGLGVICCCCIITACCLSSIAIAFFAAGGALEGNKDESAKQTGTGLLIAGGVITGLCLSKSYLMYRCLVAVGRSKH